MYSPEGGPGYVQNSIRREIPVIAFYTYPGSRDQSYSPPSLWEGAQRHDQRSRVCGARNHHGCALSRSHFSGRETHTRRSSKHNDSLPVQRHGIFCLRFHRSSFYSLYFLRSSRTAGILRVVFARTSARPDNFCTWMLQRPSHSAFSMTVALASNCSGPSPTVTSGCATRL